MRRGAGSVLAVLAAILGLAGVIFVVRAGGNEPEPIRAAGAYMLALAAVIGAGAAVVLRKR
jgi:drug/metabolite transporter (DMT)-like permease